MPFDLSFSMVSRLAMHAAQHAIAMFQKPGCHWPTHVTESDEPNGLLGHFSLPGQTPSITIRSLQPRVGLSNQ